MNFQAKPYLAATASYNPGLSDIQPSSPTEDLSSPVVYLGPASEEPQSSDRYVGLRLGTLRD